MLKRWPQMPLEIPGQKRNAPRALELSPRPSTISRICLLQGWGHVVPWLQTHRVAEMKSWGLSQTARALHDSSLTSPGLQPPSPGYQTASSPLNAGPVLLLWQEGRWPPVTLLVVPKARVPGFPFFLADSCFRWKAS